MSTNILNTTLVNDRLKYFHNGRFNCKQLLGWMVNGFVWISLVTLFNCLSSPKAIGIAHRIQSVTHTFIHPSRTILDAIQTCRIKDVIYKSELRPSRKRVLLVCFQFLWLDIWQVFTKTSTSWQTTPFSFCYFCLFWQIASCQPFLFVHPLNDVGSYLRSLLDVS